MSNQEIGDQLSMTPVYGVKVSCDEPIKILPMDQRKSILGYFFSKADAMGFAEYMKRSSTPSRENFVVSEALDDVNLQETTFLCVYNFFKETTYFMCI